MNAFRYIHKYKIAKAVPLNGTIAYADIAKICGVDAEQLKQFMRHIMQLKIFRETEPGFVGHTASSKHLTHPGVSYFTEYSSMNTIEYVIKQNDAFEKWGHGSQEPTESALSVVHNTDKSMYEYYEENQEVRERFSNLMTFVSKMDAMSNTYVAAGYDWASLGEVKVVDLAGNVGHCSVAIAKANPKASIVVQDLPEIIKRAKDPATCVIPEELRSRFVFMVHDFYKPQPVEADVFFMRMIMHDYPDKYCIKILRPLVKALRPGGRLLIMDAVLPPVGGAPAPIERFMRAQDLQMLTLTNAKERDHEQWTELMRMTDPRLQIKSITLPPGSAMAIIEVVLEEAANGHVDEPLMNGHA
jgi:hypothetical protein